MGDVHDGLQLAAGMVASGPMLLHQRTTAGSLLRGERPSRVRSTETDATPKPRRERSPLRAHAAPARSAAPRCASGARRADRGGDPRRRKDRLPVAGRAPPSQADAVNGNAEGDGLVDQVPGDAVTGPGENALRHQVQQRVVALEGRGLAMCSPIGAADDLVDAAGLGPPGGEGLDAGCARRGG